MHNTKQLLVSINTTKYFIKQRSSTTILDLEVTTKNEKARLVSANEKAYITEGSRVVSYLNTNSARWCSTSLFEMGRGGSTIV